MVVAHELLHTVNATDKYDLVTNLPLHPEGYANPYLQPLYPQRYTELMAGRIPKSGGEAETPASLSWTLDGDKTAREMGWIK